MISKCEIFQLFNVYTSWFNNVKLVQEALIIIMLRITVILSMTLVMRVSSLFCSVICKPNFCSSTTTCDDCLNDWSLSGSICEVDVSSNWTLMEKSVSLGGTTNILANPSNSTNCGVYSLDGFVSCQSMIEINVPGGIAEAHYQIRVAFMLWFKDNSSWITS